ARAGESARNEHGVTRLVAAGHQRRAHRRSSSPVGDVVNLIGSDLVDTGQQVGDHVIPGRQVKGLSVRLNGDAVAGHTVDDRAIVFGTNQRGPAQRVHVVENSQVGRTRDRAGELSRKLRVQAVNVLPGELLRHRHDDGKLDRGKRLGAAELVPGNRLLGTLTVLKSGPAANLASLGERVTETNHGLVDAHRNPAAQTHQERLLLGLAEDVTDNRLRKTVRVEPVKPTRRTGVTSSSVRNNIVSHWFNYLLKTSRLLNS